VAESSLDKAFGQLDHAFESMSKAQAKAIGECAITIVTLRTKKGLDADGRSFVPYTQDYIKVRLKKGLQPRPDLAVTGHMLGAMISDQTGPDEITVTFSSAREATKAAAHNDGVKSRASVPSHSRSVYINKKGQRASADEIARDKKRKQPQLRQRVENVTQHQRDMRTPQREFLDVRLPGEMEVLANAIEDTLIAAFEQAA